MADSVASVYIKSDSIHFYNEKSSFSNIGGIAYELGKPLLNFIWYDPAMFLDAFSTIAEAFDNDYAHIGANDPAFVAGWKESLSELRSHEPYIYFYSQILVEFVYAFLESPRQAVKLLEYRITGAEEKLRWALDFEWPKSNSPYLEVAHFADKERRLFRAVKDAVAVMHDHLIRFQKFAVHEIEVLLHYRKKIKVPDDRPIDYIDILDTYHMHKMSGMFYLERPFRTFYGRAADGKIAQLYEIDSIEDLFRFEFITMVEHEIYIKKCKNCERFFIPMRRVDAEYCNHLYGDTQRRCNEIGAMLRYERKVAENPVWEVYKKAYRRLNSRTRAKKMTQSEFMAWSEEAARKRDECLAEELSFDEFVAWLEQGRVRKPRSKQPKSDASVSDEKQ